MIFIVTTHLGSTRVFHCIAQRLLGDPVKMNRGIGIGDLNFLVRMKS